MKEIEKPCLQNDSSLPYLREKSKTASAILLYSIYLVTFLFYAWLSCHIPFTADDWRWGTRRGIEDLLNATQNSRYIGNLFVVIMTRSKILNTAIMATVSWAIPILITKLAIKEEQRYLPRALFFIIINILYLSAGSRIFSETNGWVAGYANFVISSIFFLINLISWTQITERSYSRKKDSPLICIMLFLSALAGQLFIENLAIINVLLSLSFFFIDFRKTKKLSIKYLSITIGSIIGLIIMFSSSIYTTLFHTGEELNGYRQILFLSKNSLGELVYSLVYQCARLVVRIGEENAILTIFILIVLTLRTNRKLHNKLAKIFTASNIAFCIYYLFICISGITYQQENFNIAIIAAVINLTYIITVFIELYTLHKCNEPGIIKVLLFWFFSLLTLVPLIFTNENGARLLYTFETIAIAMAVALAYPLFSELSHISAKKILCIAIIIATLITPRFFIIYSANKSCENQRLALIEAAINQEQDSVTLPMYPYPKYAGRATPNKASMEDFKNYYNIPESLEIIFEQ